jgi:multidrug efflux pump
MFFVVIRAKFAGEAEDADEAERRAQAHHAAPHSPGQSTNKNGDEGN